MTTNMGSSRMILSGHEFKNEPRWSALSMPVFDRPKGSVSRSGNCWDNAAMESFFSSLKMERTARKTYRTRDEAKADVFDYLERFYNTKRRHSTIGYLSPMEFEMKA